MDKAVLQNRYELPGYIAEGGRNDELYRYACSLWAQGRSESDLETMLMEANAAHCSPPLPDREVASIVANVTRSYPQGLSPEYEAKRAEGAGAQGKRGEGKKYDLKRLEGLAYGKCNDLWLGRRFAKLNKDGLVYVPEQKSWGVFTGTVWEISTGAECKAGLLIDSFIDEVVNFAFENGWDLIEISRNKTALSYATAYQAHGKRKNLLEECKKHLAKSVLDFDTDLNLLNVKNGTIELDTLTFREHRASDFITMVANCSYDESAQNPLWVSFLSDTFEGNDEVLRFLQARMGLALTGHTGSACFYIIFGKPRAGKSTLVEAVLCVLGDYAGTIEVKAFTKDSQGNETGHELHRIKGKRLIIGSEFDPSHAIEAQTLKRITGGGEVKARPMYSVAYYYRPTYYIFFDTNYKPQVWDETIFTSGRLKILPFTHPRPEGERDGDLPRKLVASEECKSAILNWLIDGLRLYRAFDPAEPEASKQLLQTYIADNDIVGSFIEDCCAVSNELKNPYPGIYIYTEFKSWAETHGIRPYSAKVFYDRLEVVEGISRVRERRSTPWGRTTNTFTGILPDNPVPKKR